MFIFSDKSKFRNADVVSTALTAIVVVFLVLAGYLYTDLSSRITSLNAGIREDTLWAVYQFDREAKRFAGALDSALHPDPPANSADNIVLRFDILWSRADLLSKSEYLRHFKDIPGFVDTVAEAFAVIKSFDGRISAIKATKTYSPAQLRLWQSEFNNLTQVTERLLRNTNAALAVSRADQRDSVIARARLTEIMFVLLFAAVLALLMMLRSQLIKGRRLATEAQEFAAKLEGAYRDAEAGNRAKSSFLATISHEIRTPLNAIIGLTEMLRERRMDPDALEDVKAIQGSGETLLQILNEVLDYSTLESGKLKIEKRPVDLAAIVSETVEMFRSQAARKDITISSARIGDWSDMPVVTDPTRLRQMLINLVGNAIKFTEHGEVSVRYGKIIADDGAQRLRLEVTDTGQGIDEAGLERLFKPFSQVDSSITRRYGGTGLGLSICKGIAEMLDGSIGARSEPGVGSTFWLDIPAPDAEAGAIAAADERNLAGLPALDILVVEDNATNRRVALSILESLGQKVEIAFDGAQAVSVAAGRRFDLIFMDMQMPVMSGLDAARAIRNGHGPNRATSIIAMTANSAPEDRDACVKVGMNGFETKPVRKARIAAIIRQHAGAALAGDPHEAAPASLQRGEAGGVADREPSTAAADGVHSIDAYRALQSERKAELIGELGEKTYLMLWRSFCEEARVLHAGIVEDYRNNDLKSAHARLHTLKGAAANIGMDPVARIAADLRCAERPDQLLASLAEIMDAIAPSDAAA